MIGEAPSFVKSEYFKSEPRWMLDENASQELKDEFEAYMNTEAEMLKKSYPDMTRPFYTWEGKIVDKGRADAIEAYRQRRKARLDAKDDEGRWVTTEDGNKLHINEEGIPDKGNPYVLEAAKGESKKGASDEHIRKVLSELEGEEYASAKKRGEEANEDREQYRYFARYMHGVGYGYPSHEAFNAYNYHGDSLINGMLRGKTPKSMSQQKEWRDNEEKTKKYIDDITKAIDENELRKPACVYRGIETKSSLIKNLGLDIPKGMDVESLFSNTEFLESLLGRTFADPGFVSTSIDPDFPSKGGFDKTCSMEIYCPKGTKGAYFGDNLRLTDEAEFLLQRGTQFVITGADWEEKPYGRGKRLKLKVAVVNQEPQEIPEMKTKYEPNKTMEDAVKEGKVLPKEELRSMYPNLSEGALDDIVSMRGNRNEAMEWSQDILMEEAFAGNITPYEAGELEAYACQIKDIGSRIDPQLNQYGRKLDEGHPEYKPSQETIDAVAKEYEGASDEFIERVATMRTMAEDYRRRGERDMERYPGDRIAKHLLEAAEGMKRSEMHAARAYEAAKAREKNG